MRICVSNNNEIVESVRNKLKENGGFCPCKIEKTEDTKCMCKEFLEQENGECHCGLYYKS